MRTVEFGILRRAAKTRGAAFARARHAHDASLAREKFSDEVIFRVGDDDVVVVVDAQVLRAVHGRGKSVTAIAVAAFEAGGVDHGANVA